MLFTVFAPWEGNELLCYEAGDKRSSFYLQKKGVNAGASLSLPDSIQSRLGRLSLMGGERGAFASLAFWTFLRISSRCLRTMKIVGVGFQWGVRRQKMTPRATSM